MLIAAFHIECWVQGISTSNCLLYLYISAVLYSTHGVLFKLYAVMAF